ncbi:WD repeat-containing protein 25 [Juglans microcarpa x Juglans regia]|uniref:WD repeat-containing protein 25 n=1 Tax=Juglans microcarpa x Juglans regia TaxID=2249226 RepID=UPI001B7E95D2|nr:WD repeat-containing protein 25 [Juglans microcarpa x Juglans regia]
MDLLRGAYLTASDDDDDDDKNGASNRQSLGLSSLKRHKPDNSFSFTQPEHCAYPSTGLYSSMPRLNQPSDFQFPRQAPAPGRYISKRERALLGSATRIPDANSNTPATTASPVWGSISDSNLPHHITSSLRHQAGSHSQVGRICERLTVGLHGHTKAINAIHWSPNHAHLLASASMDRTICIWNVWNGDQKKARVLSFHNAAVKDVKWSLQGCSVLSCGYDGSSRLTDIEKGIETQVFQEDQVVGVVKFHPDNSNLFLSGGAKGRLRLWDLRSGKVVHEYIRSLGPILDVDFAINGKQFISSSDVSGTNVSENSIIVWDVSRQVPLSNQVYVEAYTCPCVRFHPFDPFFVAQSNGNYIAIFSSSPPFKLDKYRRYEGHGVSGFPIKCNFSLDGQKLASGSSDGSIYFYYYGSSELVRKLKAYEAACVDVAFHPTMPNVIASCSWNGDVSVFE